MKKLLLIMFIMCAPAIVFAQVAPNNNTAPTASVANSVFVEIVTLPTYILQKYETPLVGMAIIIALFSAIFGMLRWFNVL